MRGIVVAKPLLNSSEQVLYGRLVRAFPGHIVLAHVALSRLLVVDRAQCAEAAAAQCAESATITHRFRQFVVDFVICRSNFEALAVIELDDHAQPRGARGEREQRKDVYLQAAGIKVIRVAARDLPTEAALRALVAALPLKPPSAQPMRRAS